MKKKIFIIRRTQYLVFLALISTVSFAEERAPGYDELDYFDSKTLVENNISEIESAIYLEDKASLKEGDLHSCIRTTIKFDKQGRKLSFDVSRLGFYWRTIYKDGKIVDAERINTWPEQKVDIRLSETIEDPKEWEKTLKNMNERAIKTMSTKIDFNVVHYRSFRDPCFNLDGDYRVEHQKSDTSLPTFAKAYLTKRGPEGKRSAEILYIYYEYNYFSK